MCLIFTLLKWPVKLYKSLTISKDSFAVNMADIYYNRTKQESYFLCIYKSITFSLQFFLILIYSMTA